MRILEYFLIDAFTREAFSGNPAAVILDATGVIKNERLLIAREFNVSETAFLEKLSSTSPSEQKYNINYFSPTTEVNFCGHATVAALYALAQAGSLKFDEQNISKIELFTPVGLLGCLLRRIPKDSTITDFEVSFISPEIVISYPPFELDEMLEILNLSHSDLSVNLKPAYEATLEKLLIPIKDRETLFKINYDFKDLKRFSQEKVLRGIFLFTQDVIDKESSAHSRSFAPFYGIKEDPVTGSTNCVLAKYLIENNIYRNLNAENPVEGYEYDEKTENRVAHQSQNIVLQTEQGDCLNRKGRIRFEYESDLGKRIKLIANAKLVMKGSLYL